MDRNDEMNDEMLKKIQDVIVALRLAVTAIFRKMVTTIATGVIKGNDKVVNDKRQITATLTVTASGSFLPTQLIYSGKTKRSLPKFDFPKCFDGPLHQIIGPIMRNVLTYSRRYFFHIQIQKGRA